MLHPALRRLPDAQVNRILWSAITAGMVLFFAAVAFIRTRNPLELPAFEKLAWVAIAVAVAGVLGSRALARLPAPTDPAKARTRFIVQLSICEPGALLGSVCWLFTGERLALVAVGIVLLGMVLLYPRHASAAPQAPRPLVR